MTRAGFVLAGRTVGWLASWTYYRSLLHALLATEDRTVEPVVFLGEGEEHPLLREFPSVETHRSAMLDGRTPAAAWRGAWRGTLLYDRPLGRLLERHGVDLMSHSGHLGRYRRVPTLGWVPDLQHRHLPQLFDRRTRAFREGRYRLLARLATHLVVSSEAGRRDLVQLAPRAAGKVTVLRFVIDPPPRSEQPEREELERVYGFSGPFFYLPNQFWAHKNHRLVISALGLLRRSGRPVVVLATGVQHDRRQPRHFEQLMAYARELGVEGDFRPLGVVPYPHVAALMRESLAVLNPSRFEGWSTTVEEAKSSGKRVLLSSIPVHREQAPPGGAFFDPDDPQALAELLWETWAGHDPQQARRLASAAASELPARRREFVRTYEQAVRRTLEAARA